MDKDRALELNHNGTLVGLKLSVFMALVKKEIYEKNEAKAAEYKQECGEKSVTCEICYYKFSNQSARNRHIIKKHGQNRQEVKEKDTSEYIKKCPHCKRSFKYDFPSSIMLKGFIIKSLKTILSLFAKNVTKSLDTRHP